MTAEEAWARVWTEFQALLVQKFTDAGSLFTPLVLLVTLGLCLAIWRRRPGAGFIAWLFPARIYRRQSFLPDVQVYVLSVLPLANVAPAVAALVAAGIASIAPLPAAPEAQHPLLVALVVFLIGDALTYRYHRLHPDHPALWPIHALHHSADELNPLTAARHRPVYLLIGNDIFAVVMGTLQALALLFLLGSVDVLTLLGTNVFYAVFNLAFANLRRSHVWLRYPRWLEHLLISPAQHQVHHSLDPRHRRPDADL